MWFSANARNLADFGLDAFKVRDHPVSRNFDALQAAVSESRELKSEYADVLAQFATVRKRASPDLDSNAVFSAAALHRAGLIKPHDGDDEVELDVGLESDVSTSSAANSALEHHVHLVDASGVDLLSGRAFARNANASTPQHRKRAEFVRTVNQWHLQVVFATVNRSNIFQRDVLALARRLTIDIKNAPRYNVKTHTFTMTTLKKKEWKKMQHV